MINVAMININPITFLVPLTQVVVEKRPLNGCSSSSSSSKNEILGTLLVYFDVYISGHNKGPSDQ